MAAHACLKNKFKEDEKYHEWAHSSPVLRFDHLLHKRLHKSVEVNGVDL